ncbi:glycosyl transferase [Cellulomonas sp.]|uniref:glycosyl transferase n=1 Tax=Cellulomonas sp. TaxID=40001 RepID=UPI0028123093|nr:glycosyl transferase [Cellulomonas sp.]
MTYGGVGGRRGVPDDEIGPGPLSRAAAVVWWVLAVSVLVVLTGGLPLVLVALLAWDASNAPLIALAFVPLAPALAAAVFAWRRFLADRDLGPGRHFWRGYRLNALDVLRWWVPTLAVLAVVGFSLGNLGAAGVPGGYGIVLLVVGAAVLLWAANALVLSATLSLRTRDVARLASYYLAARPLVTLGTLSLLVLSAGIVLLTSDWVLVALLGLLALLLTRNADPVLRDATARFTRPES